MPTSVCSCGNSYGKYGYTKYDSECNMPCSNQYQICGGFYKNSVYQINCVNFKIFRQPEDRSKKETPNFVTGIKFLGGGELGLFCYSLT